MRLSYSTRVLKSDKLRARSDYTRQYSRSRLILQRYVAIAQLLHLTFGELLNSWSAHFDRAECCRRSYSPIAVYN